MINIKMNFSDNTVLSVKALNEFIKRLTENNSYLSSVNIRGEISNFTNHQRSGHMYFTIKDQDAQIRCVMFSSNASKLQWMPENGVGVTAHGRVSMFVRDGQYIFYVDRMEADGVGGLYVKFEELKRKLDNEGLFDISLKKNLPQYPSIVGIITSDTGAAIQDIKNVISRRYPLAEMVLYPALVQGEGAVDDLCAGVEYFNSTNSADVIIIGRGGGSIEDLWAFNSEKLARTIHKCNIPIVSAVGHESDFTICDFVADLRAPTPSAAAELVVPDSNDLKRRLGNVLAKMQKQMTRHIAFCRLKTEGLLYNRYLKSPDCIIDDKKIRLDNLSELLNVYSGTVGNEKRKLLDGYVTKLNSSVDAITAKKKHLYIELTSKLGVLNPLSVISRGYSVVLDVNGRMVRSVDDVSLGDRLNINVSDGRLVADVIKKESDDHG